MNGHSLALTPHPSHAQTALEWRQPNTEALVSVGSMSTPIPSIPWSPTPRRNPHANHTNSERRQSFNATLPKMKNCDPLNTAYKFTVFSSLHWDSL